MQSCVKVSVVNFRAETGGGLARLLEYTRAAARQGSRIILFPALALAGAGALDASMESWAEPVPGPASKAMAALTRELQVYAAFGMPVREGDAVYNSVVLCGPEGLLGRYDALHLSPVEARWARPGRSLPPCFETPYGRVGLLSGEDCLYYFEGLRYLKARGAQLILSASAVNEPAMCAAYQKILTRRVGLNTIPIAVANLVGAGFVGGSHILSPAEPIEQAQVAAGSPLDGARAGAPGLFSAVLDMTAGRTMPHYPYFEFNQRVGSPDWRPDLYREMYEETLRAPLWRQAAQTGCGKEAQK